MAADFHINGDPSWVEPVVDQPHFILVFENLEDGDEPELTGSLILSNDFLGDSAESEQNRDALKQTLQSIIEAL